jgi:hypothetical protein
MDRAIPVSSVTAPDADWRSGVGREQSTSVVFRLCIRGPSLEILGGDLGNAYR